MYYDGDYLTLARSSSVRSPLGWRFGRSCSETHQRNAQRTPTSRSTSGGHESRATISICFLPPDVTFSATHTQWDFSFSQSELRIICAAKTNDCKCNAGDSLSRRCFAETFTYALGSKTGKDLVRTVKHGSNDGVLEPGCHGQESSL